MVRLCYGGLVERVGTSRERERERERGGESSEALEQADVVTIYIRVLGGIRRRLRASIGARSGNPCFIEK